MWYGPTEGRRLSLSDKKPRGIRRRLRWLEAWARRAADRFPDEEWMTQESYVHTKIPVLSNLVEVTTRSAGLRLPARRPSSMRAPV